MRLTRVNAVGKEKTTLDLSTNIDPQYRAIRDIFRGLSDSDKEFLRSGSQEVWDKVFRLEKSMADEKLTIDEIDAIALEAATAWLSQKAKVANDKLAVLPSGTRPLALGMVVAHLFDDEVAKWTFVRNVVNPYMESVGGYTYSLPERYR